MLVLRCCSRFPVELSDLLIHVLIIVTVTGGLGRRVHWNTHGTLAHFPIAIRAAETAGAKYTRHPCTFSKHELAKGYLQLTPRVRSRGPERSQALTNEAMELPSQVMNR